MISEGDRVLLVSGEDKFLVKVSQNSTLQTHLGEVKLKELIGKGIGDSVKSSSGRTFFIVKPLPVDMIMKLRRMTQIVYPKDISFAVFYSGISSGDKVVEAGCGSGAMTLALAHAVKPGKVFSYDVREDFISLAKENVEKAGLLDCVEFKLKDVYKDGFDEDDVEAVFLDLPEPWRCIEYAWEALKGGGVLFSLSPTYNQIERTCREMLGKFVLIEVFEVLVRRILAREGRTRPFERMVGHTGFLVFGRKIR